MNREANIFLNCLLGLALILTLGMSAALEAADAEQGRLLYRENCAQCHGLEGSGKGINAPHLEVAPRNHTDYEEMNARTNEELFKAISEGGQAVNKSVLMPNWGHTLSEEDINNLIAFLRKLCCEQ
ncbi:MAG: cytochrome c [Pseudomonadales bacterium]|nr:cytochrome c [Pseudomonadales bacterium]